MPNQTNPTVEAFLRFVNERYNDFKSRLTELMQVLCLNDSAEKARRAKLALEAAKSLEAALASQDRPAWLQPLAAALQTYQPDQAHLAQPLMQAIGNNCAAATNHQWAFDFSDEHPFDFDGLYERYEAESKIPELFDKLVELLDEIVQSGQIDSIRVLHTLETIIATLKKNRSGSYFGVLGTWNFVATYLKNIAWDTFLEVPILRVPVKALRETMEQLDKEVGKLQMGMQTELQKQLNAEFPALEYKSLPLPAPLALTDETVIDVEATPIDDRDRQSSPQITNVAEGSAPRDVE